MTIERQDSCYKDSDDSRAGHRPRFCKFDSNCTACEEGVKICEKLEILKRDLLKRKWMKPGMVNEKPNE
jgi:hypothetical protein